MTTIEELKLDWVAVPQSLLRKAADELEALQKEVETLRVHLADANKGARINAIVNRDLADKNVALQKRNSALREALAFIASKSSCACWDVPGMGSGLPYVWRGCATHNSTNPLEWCLCCAAHEALAAQPEESK